MSDLGVVQEIQKRFGHKALQTLGQLAVPDARSSGWADVDAALGIGGWPCGHLSEVVGASTSGALTLALGALVAGQAQQASVAYIDPARTFDAEYAQALGIDLDHLWCLAPDNLLETLGLLQDALESHNFGVLVLDLPAAWAGRGGVEVADQWQKLRLKLKSAGSCLLVITPQPLSPATVVRVEVAHQEWLFEYGEIIGYHSQINITKNKFAPLAPPIPFDVYLPTGAP